MYLQDYFLQKMIMYNLKVNNKKYIPQGIPESQKLEKSSVCCTIAEFLIYDLCFSKLPDEPHDFEHRVVFTQSFQRPIEFKELSDSKGIQSLLCIIENVIWCCIA